MTERRTPTVDQLRARIDRGATGDKIAAVDPAAVPLATDDEAADRPLSEIERVIAARQPSVGGAPADDRLADGGPTLPLTTALIGAAAVTMIGAALVALRLHP